MNDILEHLNRLSAAEPLDDQAIPDQNLTPAQAAPVIQGVIAAVTRLLHDMERDAYERFNVCMDGLGDRVLNPFASQHCELYRVKAAAFREARFAVSDAFPAASGDTGGAP